MELQEKFEPASQDVVSEEIDGEVIIVNLTNGNYYSLTQSAAVIWEGIQQGAPLEQIRNSLYRRYSGDKEFMDLGLSELVHALEAEKLIVRQADSEPVPTPPGPGTDVTPDEGQEVFLPPIFERFTDMEDLLLLDPVHEAEDEKGWPHAKENA